MYLMIIIIILVSINSLIDIDEILMPPPLPPPPLPCTQVSQKTTVEEENLEHPIEIEGNCTHKISHYKS